MIDLDKEGLGEYKEYLVRKQVLNKNTNQSEPSHVDKTADFKFAESLSFLKLWQSCADNSSVINLF